MQFKRKLSLRNIKYHGSGKYSRTNVNNYTSHVTSFLIIHSEASISFFLFKVTYRYHFYQETYPVLRDRCWFGYRLQVGALFTTIPSIRVSRVGRVSRVRVTAYCYH